jgi:hypothetical protein
VRGHSSCCSGKHWAILLQMECTCRQALEQMEASHAQHVATVATALLQLDDIITRHNVVEQVCCHTIAATRMSMAFIYGLLWLS